VKLTIRRSGAVVMANNSSKVWWDKRTPIILLTIFAFALIARLIFLDQISDSPSFLTPVIDSATYHKHARMLADRGEFSEKFFWQGFFYPFFLAGMYKLFGTSIYWAKLIQLLLGSALSAMVFLLGQKIFDRKTGIIAGIITALYGPLILFETRLLATCWASIWAILLVILFIRTNETKGIKTLFALGLCGGLSIITRATFILFFVAGAAWLVVIFSKASLPWADMVKRVGVIVAGMLLVLVPVSSISLSITGNFSPLPQSGPLNLYIGNNPDTDRTLMIRPGMEWRELTRMPMVHGATSEKEDRSFFNRLFLEYVASDPLGYLSGLGLKTVQFLSSRELPRNIDPYTYRAYSGFYSILTWKKGNFGFPFGLLLALAIIALYRHRDAFPIPIWLFLTLYPLAIILVFVASRYRTPVIPVMAIPAAASIKELGTKIISRRWKSLTITLIIICLLAYSSGSAGPFVVEKFNYRTELYCSVAFELYHQNRLDEAVSYLQRTLNIDPHNCKANRYMGLILNKKKMPNHAEKFFHEALRQKPESCFLNYYMGITMIAQGKEDEGTKFLRKGLQLAKLEKEDFLVERIEDLLSRMVEMNEVEE
jgi:4-amino-4-deoxy-L-arabinose transferase-like glycosyltransferase